MDLWVVGAGGLLGSAVVRRRPADARLYPAPPIPWRAAPAELDSALEDALAGFRRWREPGTPWAVVWAAGTGVVASSAADLLAQEATLLRFARLVAADPDPDGTFLFASSAAVFGRGDGVLDESVPAAPASPYAEAKLRQEQALEAVFPPGPGPGLAVARISTLYGPGQNLLKRQGLISSMCLEAVRGGVITLYVPLDTTRDYLFTDDAGDLCFALLARARAARGQGPVVRVLATHRSTTVGEVARIVQSVVHRRTHLVQAAVPGSVHVRHQLLRSTDPALAALPRTPTVVGVHRVHLDVLRRVTAGTTQP